MPTPLRSAKTPGPAAHHLLYARQITRWVVFLASKQRCAPGCRHFAYKRKRADRPLVGHLSSPLIAQWIKRFL